MGQEMAPPFWDRLDRRHCMIQAIARNSARLCLHMLQSVESILQRMKAEVEVEHQSVIIPCHPFHLLTFQSMLINV